MRWIQWRVLFATVLLQHPTHALSIDVTPVHRLSSFPSPHEPLEQRWIVAPTTSHDMIRTLEIDTLCQVYVSYAPLSTHISQLATIRVTGSDFKLITATEILPMAPQTIKIQLLDVASLDTFDGFVAISVQLHVPQTIQQIKTTGDGDVIVTDKVLIENDLNATVTMESRGAGSLFLPPQLSLTATNISFSTADAGNLYLPTASTLNATLVSFSQSGTGIIAATSAVLDAQHSIDVASKDTGSVCIDSTYLETQAIHVFASSANSTYVGSHDGSYEATHHFFCEVAQVYQTNQGNVDLGTILCIDVGVELYGSGNVTVASARSIAGHAFGPGKILYAGRTPDDVLDVDPWAFLKIPIASPAYDYVPRTCTVPGPPSRTPTRIVGRSSMVHHVVTSSNMGFVVLGLLGLGAIFLLESRRQRRHHHHDYVDEQTPLIR